jgi:hypothetical protein
MHLLKNGHPAHVFTIEDRRKAAAVTNEIRREKRALFEQLRLNREMEQMFAKDAARREPRAEKQRRRRNVQRRATGSSAATALGTDQRIPHHWAVVSDSQNGLGHPWQWPGDGQSPLPARQRELIDAVVIDPVRLNTWVVHLPSREKDVEFSASLRL